MSKLKKEKIIFMSMKDKVQMPEFWAWLDMIGRCYDPGHPKYAEHGAKGIEVCPQWLNSFETFYRDMGPMPSN